MTSFIKRKYVSQTFVFMCSTESSTPTSDLQCLWGWYHFYFSTFTFVTVKTEKHQQSFLAILPLKHAPTQVHNMLNWIYFKNHVFRWEWTQKDNICSPWTHKCRLSHALTAIFQMSGFFTIVQISKHSQNCYSTLGVNRLICLLTPFFGACRK